MGWAQFSTCVAQTSGQDISTMENVGEEFLRAIANEWDSIGPSMRAFFIELGESVGFFLTALFGEEAAEALLALGTGAVLGLILDAFVSCVGSL